MSMVFEGSRLEFNVCPGCKLTSPESQKRQISDIEWYISLPPHLVKYSRINSSGCGLLYQRAFFVVETERPWFFSPGWSNRTIEDSGRQQGPEFVEEDTPRRFRRVRLTHGREYEELQKEIGFCLTDLKAKGNLEAKGNFPLKLTWTLPPHRSTLWNDLWQGDPISLPDCGFPCAKHPSCTTTARWSEVHADQLAVSYVFHKSTKLSHLD